MFCGRRFVYDKRLSCHYIFVVCVESLGSDQAKICAITTLGSGIPARLIQAAGLVDLGACFCTSSISFVYDVFAQVHPSAGS